MWTKSRRSQLLLIKVHQAGHRKIVLPVSLVAIEQILRAGEELAEVIEDLLPTQLTRNFKFNKCQSGCSIVECFKLFRKLWDEVCSYGSWRMVEIEDAENAVEIRFF
jgi:hypothetical protein